MGRYGLNLKDAKKLQKWALEVSGAGKYLKSILKLPYSKEIAPGIYVDYDIDESELGDDGLDYCTPEIASVWAVDSKGEQIQLAGVRAYNWETYWLEFGNDCEVDTAENWWDLINQEYNKLSKQNNRK